MALTKGKLCWGNTNTCTLGKDKCSREDGSKGSERKSSKKERTIMNKNGEDEHLETMKREKKKKTAEKLKERNGK